MQNHKPKIFIAMPNLGVLRVEHVRNVLLWFLSGKYKLVWNPVTGLAPHDRARNKCHEEFMNSDCEYLFFLDSDTVPQPDVIDRLLEAGKDVISATVQTMKAKGDDPQLIPVALRWDDTGEDKGYKAYWGTGIEEVDVTTLACTLIKRKVMEAVGERAFQFEYSDRWGTDGMSEDFFFCERVRQAGFKIWNHYDILCSHHKEFDTKVVNALLVGGE